MVTDLDRIVEIEQIEIDEKAPQILWGDKYKEWGDKRKIEYLQKLTSSMNHTLDLIQNERNELNELCLKQETKIKQLQMILDRERQMIHQQLAQENQTKQSQAKEIQTLRQRIRDLEK